MPAKYFVSFSHPHCWRIPQLSGFISSTPYTSKNLQSILFILLGDLGNNWGGDLFSCWRIKFPWVKLSFVGYHTQSVSKRRVNCSLKCAPPIFWSTSNKLAFRRINQVLLKYEDTSNTNHSPNTSQAIAKLIPNGLKVSPWNVREHRIPTTEND